jgi:hypothetical protein
VAVDIENESAAAVGKSETAFLRLVDSWAFGPSAAPGDYRVAAVAKAVEGQIEEQMNFAAEGTAGCLPLVKKSLAKEFDLVTACMATLTQMQPLDYHRHSDIDIAESADS